MRRLAVIRISGELLHHLLKLPADVKVVDLSRDLLFMSNEYALKVESDSFAETVPGEQLPTLAPIYRATALGIDPEFIGWQDFDGTHPVVVVEKQ